VGPACFEQDGWGASAEAVMDCVDLAVPRLVHDVSNEQIVSRFVQELLGELLEHDRQRGTPLFETLKVYLRHSGSKTDTARALHVQRQSCTSGWGDFRTSGKRPLPLLHTGMLLLADRAYDAGPFLAAVHATGAHLLVRGGSSRKPRC
jgi:hypothetical protein